MARPTHRTDREPLLGFVHNRMRFAAVPQCLVIKVFM
jgi:hypothetical protein